MVQPPSERSRSDCKAASSSFDDPAHHVDSGRSAKKDAKLKLNAKREQRPHKSPLISGSGDRCDRSHRGGSYHGEHHRSRECRDKTKSPRSSQTSVHRSNRSRRSGRRHIRRSRERCHRNRLPRSPQGSGSGLRSDRSHRSRSSQHRRHHRSREGRRRSRSRSPRSPQISESGHSGDRSHRSKNYRRKRHRSREGRRRSRSPSSTERSTSRRRARRRQPSHHSRRSRSKRRSSSLSRSGERQPRSKKRSTSTSSFVADTKTVLDSQEDLTKVPESAREFAKKTPSNGANNKNSKAIAASAISSPQDVTRTQDDSTSIQQAHSPHPKMDVNNVYDGNVGVNTLYQVNNNYNQGKPEEKPEITEEEEVEFKDVLIKRAKEVSGEMPLPIQLDLSIQIEKLELMKGVHNPVETLDFEGHYSTRKELVKILSRSCEGNLNPEELFTCALEEAKHEAKKQTTNAEAFSKYVSRYGNIVAVIGQAGIGKTTLARKMVQLILEGKVLPDCQYIFYIPFREVDFSLDSTLFRFLMTGCRWKCSSNSGEAWVDKLEDDPNIVFIFDGLDEAHTDQFYDTKSQKYFNSSSNPVAFIRNIFSGQIFPYSKKIVTSRPKQFFELNSDLRPHFAVDIIGLSPESQDRLGKQICVDNFDLVKNFLNDHPDIASLLYVPTKSIIAYAILSISMKENGEILILSSTDLFVQALLIFIASDHLRQKGNEVWRLAVLAWDKFLLRQIIFSTHDFKQVGIVDDALLAFLITATKANIRFSIINGHKLISFTHLTWHELFTALNAIFLLSIDEFKLHLGKLSDPLWEVVSKFMFGLCNSSVNKKVCDIFPPDKVKDVDKKKKLLHEHALTVLMLDGGDPDSFLQICGWIHEAGDPELNDKAAACLPHEIRLPQNIKISPSDVTSLLYVLKQTTKPIAIEEVHSSFFVQDGLHRLLKGIASLPITIEKLAFKMLDIDDDAAMHLGDVVRNIRRLSLQGCSICSKGLISVLSKVSALSQPMKKLNVRVSRIKDEVLTSLVSVVGNVEKLSFANHSSPVYNSCDVSNASLIAIFKMIATLPQQMDSIDIGDIIIDDDKVIASLVGALHNVNKIGLKGCRLNEDAICAILNKVASLPHRMENIDLSNNNMDDDEVVASLFGALNNVDVINLWSCNLSEHAVSAISKKVDSLPYPQPEVDGLDEQKFWFDESDECSSNV